MLLLACESVCADAASFLLLEALRAYRGLSALPPTARAPLGKPYFPDYPDLCFNLSCSGPYVLCAVSDSPVGVDIETVQPRSPGLPRRVLSDAEYCWYVGRGGDWSAFYTLWTRKESWCKREGGGVVRPRLVCPPLPGERGELLKIRSYSGAGWRAAACGNELPADIQWLPMPGS